MIYYFCKSAVIYSINKTYIFDFFAIQTQVGLFLISLMSKVYFNFSLFWSLLFLQFIYNSQKRSVLT